MKKTTLVVLACCLVGVSAMAQTIPVTLWRSPRVVSTCNTNDSGLIQSAYSSFSNSSVLLYPYTSAQTAGNTNIVAVAWNANTGTVTSISDTTGNAYSLAIGPTRSGAATQYIYYSSNIGAAAAGANTVTVNLSASEVQTGLSIVEYRGLATSSALDGAAVAGTGTSTAVQTATLTTTNPCDLLFATNFVANDITKVGGGFWSWLDPDGDS